MADAPLGWKVTCLRALISAPHGITYSEGHTSKQDMIWIHDLHKDGLVFAEFRMGYGGDFSIPNLIYNIHVKQPAHDLIAEYDAQRTLCGLWKKHYLKIGAAIFTIVVGLIIAHLTHVYSIFH